jgi:hypothetical protein
MLDTPHPNLLPQGEKEAIDLARTPAQAKYGTEKNRDELPVIILSLDGRGLR